MQLIFHGGAGTVTGSCYLIEHQGGRFLVDCGLFQGPKTVRELNYRSFPFEPEKIDFLLLTHAHIDHAGLVPKLCKRGFAGRIHATSPTVDLATFMLPDSGSIQESEVERLNRRNRKRGRATVDPIYTRADAEACLAQMEPERYERWFEPGKGVRARFWNAGHILGSASIELQVAEGDGGSSCPSATRCSRSRQPRRRRHGGGSPSGSETSRSPTAGTTTMPGSCSASVASCRIMPRGGRCLRRMQSLLPSDMAGRV